MDDTIKKVLDDWLQPEGAVKYPLNFRHEAEKIISKDTEVEHKLNALEMLHRHCRNQEISERLLKPANNSAFSRALGLKPTPSAPKKKEQHE